MKLTLATTVAVVVTGLFSSTLPAADNYVAPRTQWGQPDLQGVWNFSSYIPMQRNPAFGSQQTMSREDFERLRAGTEAAYEALNESGVGGYNTFWVESAGRGDNLRTSLIVYPEDGRIPDRVEGVTIQSGGLGPDFNGERPVLVTVGGIGKDGPEDRGLSERCIVGFNSGPPFTPSMYNNNLQIIQNRDHAVLITEMIHDARIVPLDGRDHIDEDIRLWTGDSRGYWDGDTLVVVTRNFNGLTQSFAVFGSAEKKVLTERFTRVDEFTVNYEFTVDDPATFTDRITAVVPMAKVDGLMYEYACHEGNYGMVNILRGERIEEQRLATGTEQ
ncbi:MAG: hypothetical protein WDZ76_10785 [Pseudohongiellaceae bacterium]